MHGIACASASLDIYAGSELRTVARERSQTKISSHTAAGKVQKHYACTHKAASIRGSRTRLVHLPLSLGGMRPVDICDLGTQSAMRRAAAQAGTFSHRPACQTLRESTVLPDIILRRCRKRRRLKYGVQEKFKHTGDGRWRMKDPNDTILSGLVQFKRARVTPQFHRASTLGGTNFLQPRLERNIRTPPERSGGERRYPDPLDAAANEGVLVCRPTYRPLMPALSPRTPQRQELPAKVARLELSDEPTYILQNKLKLPIS
ncbi:hypothetical protein DFP72DRAFT_853508 [Ephemerocybe angulata]|uniref:Uncharacterized protein n=1 Tax=Ephemerocybe angulata TaxID=980116 RepID=A0A8H6LZ79_9AGAR|nr:hypothetical protein DFP72DRAFT_853508 [Tulosesus angulatus]